MPLSSTTFWEINLLTETALSWLHWMFNVYPLVNVLYLRSQTEWHDLLRTTALLGCVTVAFLHLVCTWDVYAHFSGQQEWEYRFLINIIYPCPLNRCRKQSIFVVFPALSDSMTAWTFLEKTSCISRGNNLGQCWNHSILIQSVRSHTVSWARINASDITGLLSFGKKSI